MLTVLKSLRDFIREDPKKQFAFLPYQLENCLLLQEFVECQDGVSRTVLHIFDSKLTYIGTIEQPDFIPDKR